MLLLTMVIGLFSNRRKIELLNLLELRKNTENSEEIGLM
jgi:hypothetical protein